MEPMQVCFSHQTAFQVLRAIDARELAGSGDTARRLPARAPSARELEEVVKRIENDRPGLSIERPVHILLGAASRCRSTSRRVSHVCTRQMRGKPLLRLSDGVGVCSAPFACVQAAPSAKNKIDLLELAYELCGTYRTRRTSTAPAYQVPPLMTMRSLRSFVSLNPSIAGARIVARGIKQEDLALELGVSRQTISSLEKGRYNPSILLAFKIARRFGLQIEDVFIYQEEDHE